MSQKQIFLESEADAWFARNHDDVVSRDFSTDDALALAVQDVVGRLGAVEGQQRRESLRILEIGCGEGKRLSWLAEKFGADVFGIEPSAKAVAVACSRGVKATRGTADRLPFDDQMFDIVLFGFCLYLCDRADLFRIAHEADRVLRRSSWLIIHDFYAKSHTQREYHHRAGLVSYKMDYRSLFAWHPAYTCYSHRVLCHSDRGFSDDPGEWVATSIMRKCAIHE